MSPKVSILMPSLNVGRYIKKCLLSVTSQTLKDIEIICIDAGSTDGTLSIIEEIAASDERVKIIYSDIKSYGYQMNLGLDAASGDYIGIVETDDFADREMFRTLYETARSGGLDVVKSDFWFYYSGKKDKNTLFKLPRRYIQAGVFCPMEIADPLDQAEFFNIKPSIWSAIYRRSFLKEHDIRFNETPGAAFQDASFNFKVWAYARKVKLIENAFLHYRQDNELSSVNSPEKVFCVCDEYDEMERFVKERFDPHSERSRILRAIICRLKYDSYLWNYMRLAEPLGDDFIRKTSEEFRRDMEKGYADSNYFPIYKWNFYRLWIKDCEAFLYELKKQQERTFFSKVFTKLRRKFS